MSASEINLNDSSPAPASGYQNAKWQKGASTGTDPVYDIPIYPVSAETPATGGGAVKSANYTAVAADCGKILSFTGSSALTLTLPAAVPFAAWTVAVQNNTTASLTIAPNGLQIDGSTSSLTLAAGAGMQIQSDGTNYLTERGAATGGITQLTGDVLAGPGSGSQVATLAASGVTAGTYTNPTVTFDSKGRATFAANGALGLYTGNYAQGSTATSGTVTAAFSGPLTAGNAIIVFIYNNNTSTVTVGDNHGGDTFNSIVAAQGFFNESVSLALNITGGSTTMSLTSSVNFGFIAFELKNIVSASALDGTPGYVGGGGGSPTTWTTSTITSNANDYLIGVGLIGGGSGWSTSWGSGFAAEFANTSGDANGKNFFMGDGKSAAPGAQSVSWSTPATAGQQSLYLIALKSTGTSSTGVTSVNSGTGAVTIAAGTGISVSTSGSTVTVAATGSGPTLETNGTTNGSQSLLNLAAGSNVTLTDNGTGTITVASTGTGSGMSNPMTTVGDVIVGGTVTGGVAAPTRLAAGTSGYVLTSNGPGAAPSYQVAGSGGTPTPLMTRAYYRSGGGRAFGTVYQNTSSYPMILVGLESSTGATVYCDASSSPSTVVWSLEAFSGAYSPYTAIVPAGYYYKITGTTFVSWNEYLFTSGAFSYSGNLSGSRALNTAYQNTGTGAMFVGVYISGTSSGNLINVYSDSSSSPSAQIYQMYPIGTTSAAFFVVPPGHYYKVTSSAGSIATWVEMGSNVPVTKSANLFSANSGLPTQRAMGNSTYAAPSYWNNSQTKVRWPAVLVASNSTGTLIFGSDDSTWPQALVNGVSATNPHQKTVWGPVMPQDFYSVYQDNDSNPVTKTAWWEYVLG